MTSTPAIPVAVIVGPTAVGKTALAIRAAGEVRGEIVSADSRQIFRRMDVGTAKPTAREQAAVPHHLIDVAEPNESFDAGEFRRRAEEVIRTRWEAGVPCLLVGGSGLYVRALLYGLADLTPPAPGSRERLREEVRQLGALALHERLAREDPVAAARIHPNDAYRITRALEIFESSGIPPSTLWERHAFREQRFETLSIGLDLPDEELKARIQARALAMWGGGILEETRLLLESGFPRTLPSLGSMGYAEAVRYLKGECSKEDALDGICRRTWRYARRQRVWFRADPSIEWHVPERDSAALLERIREFLSHREMSRDP